MDDHKKLYIKNAIYLTVLTVLEVGVSYLEISQMGQIVLLLAFAATKMMLVAMIYMHLRYETKALKRILFVPIPAGILFTVALMYDIPFRWVV
ncbi:MAG: cytochrome C oxidase subunit IV family protein [Candidatus Marinimicrobia bacterium]|jgi:caa(3)-type oxidase subunit IV|nr:cytochrome C oxidase subunit IV family protein [Candidatus Neomarinimicrobiota bacterium]MDP7273310.1 cytochrome C oxidase subunit IV family protein [Candidatus Neomarinimicrobiota bacterium]MDP7474929.1 cytochrome C oxidase subunit IV family protein [Candidatus Neomarinimicrobiota bacterium]|tara:strand:- start:448 stop:726 length:279 start_codon:yes stop_codon:yes gene_type:complete